jgi:peptidoglycan/LPS O-acetylase OafA/YrhL
VNALVLLQLFAVCWLAMRCVERPGIRLGRRLAGAFVKRYGV